MCFHAAQGESCKYVKWRGRKLACVTETQGPWSSGCLIPASQERKWVPGGGKPGWAAAPGTGAKLLLKEVPCMTHTQHDQALGSLPALFSLVPRC